MAITKNDNPCKDCLTPVRHIGCHANCEKYLTWKKAYDEWNNMIFEKRTKEIQLEKYAVNRSIEAKKRYRRKKT